MPSYDFTLTNAISYSKSQCFNSSAVKKKLPLSTHKKRGFLSAKVSVIS